MKMTPHPTSHSSRRLISMSLIQGWSLAASSEPESKLILMKTTILLLLAACSFLLACQPSRQSNRSVDLDSPKSTPSPSVAASIRPAPSTSSTTASDMKEAEYNDYPYNYKRDGDTTVAMFVKRFLPRDDAIVVGAIRDVIRRAYKEETHKVLYLVDPLLQAVLSRGAFALTERRMVMSSCLLKKIQARYIL